MLALALRGLAARKLRAALTAFAILLGVAMVAGTFMLKGSLDTAFDDIFASATEGIDVSVRAEARLRERLRPADDGSRAAAGARRRGRRRRRRRPGRRATISDDTNAISILDDEGERIGPPQGGPPHIANATLPEPFDPFTYVEGAAARQPTTRSALDPITAEEEGYEVGEHVSVSGRDGDEGVHALAASAASARACRSAAPAWPSSPSPRRSGSPARRAIRRDRRRGRGRRQPRGASRRASTRRSGPSTEAKTGEELAADESGDIKDGFSFLTTALLVFAGISVFVGAFLIFNTFSITVAQRTREFGMLRTLGASSRQVLASVVARGARCSGIIASVVGIVARLRLRRS